jgi:hypothetical protein
VYIMRNIPTYEETVASASTTALAKPRKAPIGLDEAVEIKRRAITALKATLDNPGEGTPGTINQLEGILNYDTVSRVVSERLTAVQDELAFWTQRQQKFISATQQDAARVLAELELLASTDIIAYNLARRSFEGIRVEIERNEQLLQAEFTARINALNQYRERLQQDLDRDTQYEVGGALVTSQQLRDRVQEIKTEVTALGKRDRRAALDDVWAKAAQRGISPRQLMQMANDPIALSATFTPAEIEIITAATAGGENSALALYIDLSTLSTQMRELNQLKDSLWDELQEACGNLERNYGYRLTFQISSNNELLVSDLEDIEPNRAQRFKTPKSPDQVLAKIANISGVRQIGTQGASAARSTLPEPAIAIASATARNTSITITASNARYENYLRQIRDKEESISDAINKSLGTRYATMGDRERYSAIIRLMQQQADAAYITDALYDKLYADGQGSTRVEVRSFQQGLIPALRTLYNALITTGLLGGSDTPTTLVEVLQQLEINRQRRLEVDRRLEVVGFKQQERARAEFRRRMQSLVKFKSRVGTRS